MLRIITHIERLLLVHDCVIVPGWGGFVLQTVSAVCNEKEHLFSPQRKEIVFNITLQHNDGLLSESYMQMYDVNYRKAQLMLEEDVADMKAALQEEKTLSLGVLGSFSLGQEGQVIFHPGESDAFSVGSYGLVSFNFPLLQPVLAEREEVALLTRKRKKDILYIPVSRKFLRVAAASAAAVALFLLISTPVKDVNQAAYTASFVPTEMVVKSAPEIKPVEEVVPEDYDDKEEMDPDEFAQYACKYATEIDCSITGKSLLALYERIEMMEEDEVHLTKAAAVDLIEEAADKAEKKSLGKKISGLFSPNYTKEGLLILHEKDFFD